MRFLLLFMVVLIAVQTTHAEAAPPPGSGSESLGGQLLDDLPGIQSRPASNDEAHIDAEATSDSARAGAPAENNPELRYFPLRFDDVGGGGNVDQEPPSGPLRLVRAGQGMLRAEALLAKHATVADAHETQQQVVAQLDVLIAELSKQCNCQGGGASSNKPPSPSQRSGVKPGKSGGKPGRGGGPARDSDARLDGSKPETAEKGELEETVKRLWGHLPQRQREQMMQTFSNEFLPKYELEIEQYYQGLSEEGREDRQ